MKVIYFLVSAYTALGAVFAMDQSAMSKNVEQLESVKKEISDYINKFSEYSENGTDLKNKIIDQVMSKLNEIDITLKQIHLKIQGVSSVEKINIVLMISNYEQYKRGVILQLDKIKSYADKITQKQLQRSVRDVGYKAELERIKKKFEEEEKERQEELNKRLKDEAQAQMKKDELAKLETKNENEKSFRNLIIKFNEPVDTIEKFIEDNCVIKNLENIRLEDLSIYLNEINNLLSFFNQEEPKYNNVIDGNGRNQELAARWLDLKSRVNDSQLRLQKAIIRKTIIFNLKLSSAEKEKLSKKLGEQKNLEEIKQFLLELIIKYKLGWRAWLNRRNGAPVKLLLDDNWGVFLPESYKQELAFAQGNKFAPVLSELTVDGFWGLVKAGSVPVSEKDMNDLRRSNQIRDYGKNPSKLRDRDKFCDLIAEIWVQNVIGGSSWLERKFTKLRNFLKNLRLKNAERLKKDSTVTAMPVELSEKIIEKINAERMKIE